MIRLDAVPKVSGSARYLADLPFAGLDGVLVPSAIAAGSVEWVDGAAALDVPGVVRMIAPGDLPTVKPLEHWAAGQSRVPLMDEVIRHEGQPVALVLAEDRRAAEQGALRVRVTYRSAEARFDGVEPRQEAVEVKDWAPSSTTLGDVGRALASAPVRMEAAYQTADRHHAALEPAAVIADWRDGVLEVITTTQWVVGVKAALGIVTGLAPERIRVRTEFVGGGFGAKGSTWPHEILAVLASRLAGRPVRIVLPRHQSFTAHGYQPGSVQDVSLGASVGGALTALRHHGISYAAVQEDYVEHTSLGSRSMYRCPNIHTQDRILRQHRPQPTFMRAPHEGPGMVGLEIAMDELAYQLGHDPLDLRLANNSDHDSTTGRPFSSKRLAECYRLGADLFGWSRRTMPPGSMRDGSLLVGWGMASALMSTFRFASSARVTVRRNGRLLVESAAHEIGTGVGTMLALVVGEALGADPRHVDVRLGDTALPEAAGTFGSGTTMGVGSAALLAARQLKAKLEALAGESDLRFEEYPEVLALRQLPEVSESADWAPTAAENAYAMNAYGAVFVEVKVDPLLPIPRVSRIVGAYSVGRIINPVGATSQVIGGITWGIGQALLEDSRFDPSTGRFLARSLSSYHVPANADVPPIQVRFAEEHDPHASTLGSRGVGEIGTIGVGAAIANAVFHATGRRVRRVPIRIEDLL